MTRVACNVDDARALGLLRYFTGKPCKRGHIAERLTSNKTCMQCAAELQSRLYEKNGERIKARVARYHRENKAKKAASDRVYQQRNRERLRAYYSQRYYKKRVELTRKVKEYRKQRPGFSLELGKAYLMRKARAMPAWVDRAALRAIYAEAEARSKEAGVTYSVDHIYPINGRHSCGLHVPWNLQIITKIDNSRKGTKTPEEWGRLQSGTAMNCSQPEWPVEQGGEANE